LSFSSQALGSEKFLDYPFHLPKMAPVQILLSVEVFILGLLLGSFLALAAVRLPKGESILWPRSHCRSCDRPLKWYENIPIFGYLGLRGRCSSCGAPISFHHLVLELLTAALTLFAYYQIQPWPRFVLWLLLFILPVLLLMTIDARELLLPFKITKPGIVAGFLAHWIDGRLWPAASPAPSHAALLLESLIGALAGGLTLWLIAWLYRKLRKAEGLGGGDVYFAAMLGAFFGWKAVFFIFFLASTLGALLGGVWILLRRKSHDTHLPFGLFLGAVALIYLFYGPFLVRYYIKFIHSLI
jgi:leader peptidase (prepilin peptidase)/N-methyltransferase